MLYTIMWWVTFIEVIAFVYIFIKEVKDEYDYQEVQKILKDNK